MAREVKTVDGWILEDELPQGNIYWPEAVERRGLHSKTYKDPLSNTFRFIANTKGAPRHFRADGTLGSAPLTDIDLTDPDNIQTFYTLSRLTGTAIGYQYTPRDKTDLTITIRLENYTGTGVPNERGEVWYENIATDLDIYSKPLPYRYGIFKVLKGPSAPTTFVFNGSATGEPQAINDAFGGSWTMQQLQSLKKIEDINAITWNAGGAEVLMPARVAWDGNGDPVQVRVTAEYVPSSKSIKLTEQVVLGESPVWPITVDTDVSYNSTTGDGHILGASSTYSTAQSTGTGFNIIGSSFNVGQRFADPTYTVWRGVCFFPTGELPDDAALTVAVISLDGYSDQSVVDFVMRAVAYTGNTTLAAAEFGNFGTTSYGTWDSSTYSDSWNTITLNSTGIAAISKTADTPIGFRSEEDVNQSEPSDYEYVLFVPANSSPDPKIDITYSAGTTTPKSLTANVTAAASMVKSAGKVLSGSVTAAGSMVKAAGKALSAGVTATASAVKAAGKILSAGVTAAASMTRAIAFAKALTASVTVTASMIKDVAKSLTASVTVAASMLHYLNYITLVAEQVLTVIRVTLTW